ncbi:DUF3829 domain-containing protein [Veillonella dispar]|uniref:DUF3829 domain-containing protein n=1 Tax=uncultured Veillonella sp. TaxID=159268 RepID=UPI00101EDBEF|nr:DUF3829 domain-containing protein [uncultured Veillonella sp.]MTG95468.1 DUF3829 domain-containing protein [Veillonella dispar]MTH32386.1 DUF3829 domain-containing protein [Veillonella dispar]MTH38088.1 DUF3829 domain-containing protein [Veillonella dispar]RYS56452.1 DUF3829 domain-containing protein [Veillonella dispar]
MKPLVKKMITVVLCASTLTAPLFLTGCSVSKVANSVQQGVQKTSQDDVKVFNNYIKAVGDFNSHTVRFGYAIGPNIQKLREGQHLTSFMSPHFDSLQKNLQAAKDAGVPYDDMKEPLDNVLAILKDIVPVASELDTYYETNSYQADNYAKEQQLGPKYVQLYDQFYAAYNQLDAVIHKHNTENQQEQLKELKESGKKNAAAAQEVHLRLTALLDGFEEGKQIDVNAANQELQGIMDVSNSITSSEYNSTKNSLNTAIGRIRTFLGDQTNDHYNDMVESYNRFIGSMNRLDMNKLDK